MKKSIFRGIFSLLLTLLLTQSTAFASESEHHEAEEVKQSESIQNPAWAESPTPVGLDDKNISRYAIQKQIENGDAKDASGSISGYLWLIGILVLLIFGGIGAVMSDVQKMTAGQAKPQNYNKLNGSLMLGFIILFMGLVFYEVIIHGKYVRMDSASEHGQAIDTMLLITLLITGAVFVITQILLFFFAWKYQYNPNRKALYYPENDTLEIAWTVAPAIVLTILVLFGFRTWNNTMINHENKDINYTEEAYPYQVELFAYQFGWKFRYPGPDGIFGDFDFRNISYDPENSNPLGVDVSDPYGKDDLVLNELKMPKDKLTRFVMRSSDVLHAAHFPDFNAQIYCIPNTQTEFHIKPVYSSKQKKEMEGNDDYEYELACNQICGRSHYAMRQEVEVMEEDEYKAWMASVVSKGDKLAYKVSEKSAEPATNGHSN